MARLRITRQMRLIDEHIKGFNAFFTADELFESVVKTEPHIGIATVYRYLNERKNDGMLHTYYCDRRRIYSINENSHCHFICSECGNTEHVKIEKIDFLKKGVEGKVCHFQIDIYGICKKCLDDALHKKKNWRNKTIVRKPVLLRNSKQRPSN